MLTVLREADAFYREQQRLGRTVRRGFLDLAKARQQHGAGSISALNLRKDLEAQQSVVPVEDFEKCSVQDLSAATPFRLRRGPPGEAREPALPEPSERRLRQRNNHQMLPLPTLQLTPTKEHHHKKPLQVRRIGR